MKKVVEKVKELNKTSKGKAVLFFAFYFVFFVVVVLIFRFSDRKPLARSEDYEPGNGRVSFYMDNILKNNYIYGYTITLDGVKRQYYGQRYNDTELFEFESRQFFRLGNDFYVKNALWEKSVNPYLFPEFLDMEQMAKVVEAASYQSKTSYEDGRKTYNFLISSNTINKILKNIDSDFLEEPNTLIVGVDGEKNVNKLEMGLDSYCRLNKLCNNSLKIEIEYDMFGEVTKIDNPIG